MQVLYTGAKVHPALVMQALVTFLVERLKESSPYWSNFVSWSKIDPFYNRKLLTIVKIKAAYKSGVVRQYLNFGQEKRLNLKYN